MQITWVYTSDLLRSHEFYHSALGFEMIRDEGDARIYQCCEGAGIGVCREFDDRVVEPKGSMISLVTDDVEGWYGMLLQAGVSTDEVPHYLEKFGIYTFFVKDPDGYTIEIQQFQTEKKNDSS